MSCRFVLRAPSRATSWPWLSDAARSPIQCLGGVRSPSRREAGAGGDRRTQRGIGRENAVSDGGDGAGAG
jgi:hypothetical protein